MANTKVAKGLAFLVYVVNSCCYLACFGQSTSTDTLCPGDRLRNNETLISARGVFELGFFSSGGSSSSNHYLGIWFKNDQYKKPVWVANRENPILDSSGFLRIRYDGNLVITDVRRIPIIVNYGMLATSSNTSAKLLDSGNLILTESEKIVWQSFNYPSDTFLPGMKLGFFNLDTDHMRTQYLVSWVSPLVPTTGPFALGPDTNNKTVFKVWRRDLVFRQIGFWDGHRFRLFFESASYNFTYVSSSKEIYLTFNNKGNDSFSWFVLTSTGEINEFTMLDHGVAFVYHTLCAGESLLKSKGCLIPMPSVCGDNDKFSEIRGSMPNSMILSASVRMGPSDCEIMCRSNCSCTAYASLRDDGTGCELYYGDKKDLFDLIGKGNDNLIYVRGDSPTNSDIQEKRRLLLIVIVTVVSFAMLMLIFVWCYLRGRKYSCIDMTGRQDAIRESASLLLFQFGTNLAAVDEGNNANGIELSRKKGHELPLLSFSCIATATDNFSNANKLGEGGFGPVYKGKLLGYDIAVKRLSRLSGQGLQEFRNEVQLISKLQHRNLVRLLGYCIQPEEKILIYEYMPNNSLDSFIFDPSKRSILDWRKRVHIIEGIAQGLLYLHLYSILRIIHRDLKTSNILLDNYMNPKISDFGMARILNEDNSRAKTKRVVGTYGYMSPEYAVHGIFSAKSDVFSFGVIMLEVISGRKNTSFYESDRSLNLLGYYIHFNIPM
ncbi:G-type lectin S-receptor-like serine/threonine-protein kinase At1g67520 isoform X2 [Cornus florida]|uniref:G-type lectin S-receptor-like serine/threonine-protein kinase At1g67520 isoform X2 n=1 Tax=Cornus florida TaxID=4283 RepID=UPI00289B2171|nr:G-type lectin S-receptor-like serine/threonine-protein kinase At1g67520 isoform X2 [Cornus florida]